MQAPRGACCGASGIGGESGRESRDSPLSLIVRVALVAVPRHDAAGGVHDTRARDHLVGLGPGMRQKRGHIVGD